MNNKQHYNLFDFRQEHGDNFDSEYIKLNYEQNKEYYNQIIYDYVDACFNDIREKLEDYNYYIFIRQINDIKDSLYLDKSYIEKVNILNLEEVINLFKIDLTLNCQSRINLSVIESFREIIGTGNGIIYNGIEEYVEEMFIANPDYKTYTINDYRNENPNVWEKLDKQILNTFSNGGNAVLYFNKKNIDDCIENSEFDFTYKDLNGDTLLTFACKHDILSAYELLKFNNININHANQKGDTAFILACQHSPELAKYLLKRTDVEINRQNINDDTGFIIACHHNPELAEVLINNNYIDIYKENIFGETGFSILAKNQKSLLNYYVEKERNDKNTETNKILEILFSKYVLFNQYNIKYFISNKYFSHDFRDQNGNTLLIAACIYDPESALKILRKNPINLNNKNSKRADLPKNSTPLMAASFYNLKLVDLITEIQDVDTTATNNNGLKALDYISESLYKTYNKNYGLYKKKYEFYKNKFEKIELSKTTSKQNNKIDKNVL